MVNSVDVDDDTPLLGVLRDVLEMTETKDVASALWCLHRPKAMPSAILAFLNCPRKSLRSADNRLSLVISSTLQNGAAADFFPCRSTREGIE
jgi:hypothetical protein